MAHVMFGSFFFHPYLYVRHVFLPFAFPPTCASTLPLAQDIFYLRAVNYFFSDPRLPWTFLPRSACFYWSCPSDTLHAREWAGPIETFHITEGSLPTLKLLLECLRVPFLPEVNEVQLSCCYPCVCHAVFTIIFLRIWRGFLDLSPFPSPYFPPAPLVLPNSPGFSCWGFFLRAYEVIMIMDAGSLSALPSDFSQLPVSS